MNYNFTQYIHDAIKNTANLFNNSTGNPNAGRRTVNSKKMRGVSQRQSRANESTDAEQLYGLPYDIRLSFITIALLKINVTIWQMMKSAY